MFVAAANSAASFSLTRRWKSCHALPLPSAASNGSSLYLLPQTSWPMKDCPKDEGSSSSTEEQYAATMMREVQVARKELAMESQIKKNLLFIVLSLVRSTPSTIKPKHKARSVAVERAFALVLHYLCVQQS